MVTAGDFRNGVTFEMDGNVYSITSQRESAAFLRKHLLKKLHIPLKALCGQRPFQGCFAPTD